ncbi:unnamed protein product, partial [Ectocarpus sp. 8 AP-2014]
VRGFRIRGYRNRSLIVLPFRMSMMEKWGGGYINAWGSMYSVVCWGKQSSSTFSTRLSARSHNNSDTASHSSPFRLVLLEPRLRDLFSFTKCLSSLGVTIDLFPAFRGHFSLSLSLSLSRLRCSHTRPSFLAVVS